MAAVASKNPYEALGNHHDEDSDAEAEPQVNVVDKTPARTDKRNAPREAPSKAPSNIDASKTNRRGGYTGNELAYRDRNAGAASNRGKPVDDGFRQDRHPDGAGGRGRGTYYDRGRGGRGRGGRGREFDRHSGSLAANSEKQAGHGWGANDANAEFADEKAAETIAETEEKDALATSGGDAPVDTDGTKPDSTPVAEPEPEDTSISYADYLAQQAEKKLALGTGIPEARKPNEGTREDKKWLNAKPLSKEDDEFIAGSGGKAKRERERKQKQLLEIDQRYVEAPDRGGRGGRGGRGRGDGSFRGSGPRGDGPYRGGRGGYAPRARGSGDGAPRANRGGPYGNGYNGPSIDTEDTSAFPSLGA